MGKIVAKLVEFAGLAWSKLFSRARQPTDPNRAGKNTRRRSAARPAGRSGRYGQRGGGKLVQQICSDSNLLQAWRKVKANGGGPGVDGESLRVFEDRLAENVAELRDELWAGNYRPQPIRRVWVPKPGGGERALAILTVRDRVAQRAVYDVLAPLYEAKFLPCSYGFREGLSIQDAVQAVTRGRDDGMRWVVDGDIRDCFASLDHGLLLRLISRDVHERRIVQLIERWLKARIFNELDGRNPAVGTFQGGVISPLVANVYLHEFDLAITKSGLRLVRYADDWLILCAKKSEAQAALQTAVQALEQLRLAINPYKTRLVHFDQGFAFLGVFFVRSEYFYLSPGVKRPPASSMSPRPRAVRDGTKRKA